MRLEEKNECRTQSKNEYFVNLIIKLWFPDNSSVVNFRIWIKTLDVRKTNFKILIPKLVGCYKSLVNVSIIYNISMVRFFID